MSARNVQRSARSSHHCRRRAQCRTIHFRHTMPDGWLGDVPHTHLAIDDARGYAHLLGVLLAKGGAGRSAAD
jgi:hypothetical protein